MENTTAAVGVFPTPRPPVAIGGVGGSGTRLVAQIIQSLGCFIGAELNGPKDNLWFSALLRRELWFRDFPADADIRHALDVFALAMTAAKAAPRDVALLDQVERELHLGEDPLCPMLLRVLQNLRTVLTTPAEASAKPPPWWGWKEPNTHIFLPQIAAHFDDIRYIHVIRNGLDMAFGANQIQIGNWGAYLLGDGAGDGGEAGQRAEIRNLDFWIAANTRAIRLGQQHLGHRFHLVNYERLCLNPREELEKLSGFLGTGPVPDTIVSMITPRAIGRHKDHDTGFFRPDQLQAVSELGAV